MALVTRCAYAAESAAAATAGHPADQTSADERAPGPAVATTPPQAKSVANAVSAVPAESPEAQDQRALQQLISSLHATLTKGNPVNWPAVTDGLFGFASKYPASGAAANMARTAMYFFELAHRPEEAASTWQMLAGSPNLPLAQMARDKVRAFAAINGLGELAFTALDGREVDLKKLRGKVVLVDFWATWCAPCMKEMPKLKSAYAAYHDRGFEIVGISCDVSPEGAKGNWVKMAKTGPQVLEFTKKNEMPWPQYYDGHKHNDGGNSLATRFAVTGLPGSFLLDQAGTVVALNLIGDKVETEVKRLLKL